MNESKSVFDLPLDKPVTLYNKDGQPVLLVMNTESGCCMVDIRKEMLDRVTF